MSYRSHAPAKKRIHFLVALVATASLGAAQRIWIVDAANGPGTDFRELQPALNASRAGDTVLVRRGGYTQAATNKGVRLIGGDGVRLTTTRSDLPPFRLSGLPAGEDFVMQGFEISSRGLASTNACLRLENCKGRITLADLQVRSVPLLFTAGGAGLAMTDCAQVSFLGGTLTGAPGLLATKSVLSVTNGKLVGTDALGVLEYGWPSHHALEAAQSQVLLSFCELRGGRGANNRYRGTFQGSPAAILRSCDTSAGGDNRAFFEAGDPPATNGTSVPAIDTTSGTLVLDPAIRLAPKAGAPPIQGDAKVAKRRLSALFATGGPPGSAIIMELYSPSGHVLALLAGIPGDRLMLPFGALWLDLRSLLVMQVAVQNPGEHHRFVFVLPALLKLVGQPIVLQALSTPARRLSLTFSNPAPVVVRAFAVTIGQDRYRLFTLSGDAWPGFGHAVGAAGDVNRDGHADVIVGAPYDGRQGTGSARVFSGRDGRELYTFYGDANGDEFGFSVSGAGDIDRDGYPDVIVGAPSAGGRGFARAHSGRDGKALFTWTGDVPGGLFGWSVAGVSDVNLDGHADVVIGMPLDDKNGAWSGTARVYSGNNGKLLHLFKGDSALDTFGHAVAGAGDVNKDGVPDVLVGAKDDDATGKDAGSVRVHSGKDGKVLWTFHGASPGARLGWSVAGAGDVNKDGYADIIAGAPQDGRNGQFSGSASVHSGRDGTLLFRFDGDAYGDGLGSSVGGGGDLDKDGWPDLVAGAPGDANNHYGSGSVRAFSGRDGRILYTIDGRGQSDRFGSSLALAGDVNGDGHADVVAGARGSANLAPTVRVLSGRALRLTSDRHEISLAQGGTQAFSLDVGTGRGDIYLLLGSFSGTRPGLRFGGVTLPLNPDPWFHFTLANPNTLIQASKSVLDAQGRGTARFVLPKGLDPRLADLLLHHAFLVLNARTLRVELASNAVPLRLVR